MRILADTNVIIDALTSREPWNKSGKVKEEVQSILALTLAKAAAIVPGQVLTNEEMTGLVDGLFAVAGGFGTVDGLLAGRILQCLEGFAR